MFVLLIASHFDVCTIQLVYNIDILTRWKYIYVTF